MKFVLERADLEFIDFGSRKTSSSWSNKKVSLEEIIFDVELD